MNVIKSIKQVIAAFRRDDRRAKAKFYSQKRNRRSRRVQQFLHKISKDIVKRAKESHSMIVLEDIKGIRKLYRKGNG